MMLIRIKKLAKNIDGNIGMMAALVLPVLIIAMSLALSLGPSMNNQSNMQQVMRAALVLPSKEYMFWRIRAAYNADATLNKGKLYPCAQVNKEASLIRCKDNGDDYAITEEAQVMAVIQKYVDNFITTNASSSPQGLQINPVQVRIGNRAANINDWANPVNQAIYLYTSLTFNQSQHFVLGKKTTRTASAESGKILRPAFVNANTQLSAMVSTPGSSNEGGYISGAVTSGIALLGKIGYNDNLTRINFGVVPHSDLPSCPAGGCGMSGTPTTNTAIGGSDANNKNTPWDGGVSSNSTSIAVSGGTSPLPQTHRSVQHRISEFEGSFWSVPGRRCRSGQTIWTYKIENSGRICYTKKDYTGGCFKKQPNTCLVDEENNTWVPCDSCEGRCIRMNKGGFNFVQGNCEDSCNPPDERSSDFSQDNCRNCSSDQWYLYPACRTEQPYKNIIWQQSCKWEEACGTFGGPKASSGGTEGYVFPETAVKGATDTDQGLTLHFTAQNVDKPEITLVAEMMYDTDDASRTNKYLPVERGDLFNLTVLNNQNWATYECPEKDVAGVGKCNGGSIFNNRSSDNWNGGNSVPRYLRSWGGSRPFFGNAYTMNTDATNGDNQCIRALQKDGSACMRSGANSCMPGANKYKLVFRRNLNCGKSIDKDDPACQIPQGYYKFFVTSRGLRNAPGGSGTPSSQYVLLQGGEDKDAKGGIGDADWSMAAPPPGGTGCRSYPYAPTSDYPCDDVKTGTSICLSGRGGEVQGGKAIGEAWGNLGDSKKKEYMNARFDKVVTNGVSVPKEQLLVASFSVEVGRINETLNGIKRSIPTGVILDGFTSGGEINSRGERMADIPDDAKAIRFSGVEGRPQEVANKNQLVLNADNNNKEIPLGIDAVSWDDGNGPNSNVDTSDTAIGSYEPRKILKKSGEQTVSLLQSTVALKRIDPVLAVARASIPADSEFEFANRAANACDTPTPASAPSVGNKNNRCRPDGFRIVPNAPVNSLSISQFGAYMGKLNSGRVFTNPDGDSAHGSCLATTLAARALTGVNNRKGLFFPVLKCVSKNCTRGVAAPFSALPFSPEANNAYNTSTPYLTIQCPDLSTGGTDIYQNNLSTCWINAANMVKQSGGEVFPFLTYNDPNNDTACSEGNLNLVRDAYNKMKSNPNNQGAVGGQGCIAPLVALGSPAIDVNLTAEQCAVRLTNTIVQKYVGDETCEGLANGCQ